MQRHQHFFDIKKWTFVLNVLSFSLWSLSYYLLLPSYLSTTAIPFSLHLYLLLSHSPLMFFHPLFSSVIFHPSIPLSPQSRRQQDPSPGSNMANADVEHKMRWGRVEGGRGWQTIHFQYNRLKTKSKRNCSCSPLFLNRFDRTVFKSNIFWIFECRKAKRPELVELKVNKSNRNEGLKELRLQQTWSWFYLNTEEGTWVVDLALHGKCDI